jgi:uncharacterized membrane protein YccF (DUF307 family)
MTPQQYVGLFVRLFAVWLFFGAAQSVGVGVALDSHGHSLAPYVIAGLQGIASVTLWCFPMFVARKLVPQTNIEERSNISAVEVATVACIVLGLWLCVARVFPSLTRYVSVVLVLLHEDVPLSGVDTKSMALMIESIAEFIVALALVFKARAIATHLLMSRKSIRAD